MFSYPGRDPEVAIGEQAAKGGDKSALAGMGGGAEDHEKAGHDGEDGVQAYLPFGRWSLLRQRAGRHGSSKDGIRGGCFAGLCS